MHLSIVHPTPTCHPSVTRLTQSIAPGSILVAQPAPHGGVQVDYEGGIYQRPSHRPPTLDEQIEYAKRAAGRMHNQYPTVARAYLRDADFERDFRVIGSVDPTTWTVTFHPPTP